MVYILSIDAAAKGCSVALSADGQTIGYIENKEEKSAATFLSTYILDVCLQNQLTLNDLSAVAVGKGPGSYTGLRVAVSTAKGLAMALNIPLISFNSLDAMAAQLQGYDSKFICSMLDARRLEVYARIYYAKTLEVFKDTEAVIVDADSFKETLSEGTCLFIGDGSPKCESILQSPNALFLKQNIGTQAQHVSKMVFEKFKNSDFEDLVRFEPFYLKEYMFKTKAIA
jgi:tRNA threonylcarbamoyladenosine biosynthesis protein TsaB